MTSDWFLLSQCSGGLDALGEIWGAWKGRKWWVERRAVVWEWDCGSSVRQRRCPIRLPVPLMPGSDTGVKALQSATSVKTTAFLYIGNISKKLSGVCVSYTLLCVENIHENKHILQAAAEQNWIKLMSCVSVINVLRHSAFVGKILKNSGLLQR